MSFCGVCKILAGIKVELCEETNCLGSGEDRRGEVPVIFGEAWIS